MEAPWESSAQALHWDRALLQPPPGLFWTFPKPASAVHRPAAEISLWTLLAAMQAMERKVDVHAGWIQRLERRAEQAERKISGAEKTVTSFGPRLDALGTLVQSYGQLQRRLADMEELLKNRNFWVLSLPPGARGETTQVPESLANASVYCSEQEWEDSASGPKERQEADQSVVSMDCATSNPRSLSPTEGGSPSSDEHQGHSGEAEDTQQDRAEAALLTAMAVPAETKTANQGQFSPSPGSSEQEILPFSKEDVVLMDSQTAALQQPASSGGNIGNFTTIVVQDGVLPGEAPYVCPDCGRSFLYEEQCALHQQSHRQASLGPRSNPVRCPQPVAKLYTCLDCGRGFPHQASLSKHRLWHTGDRPHTCAECKKTFRLKINLHLHERTHAVAKKTGCYICGQCGRTFNHHSNFLRHQMIHTGERPYTCGECGKTFIRKEHLATHRRLHTGERPYRCPLCPKSFTRKQHLVGHQRLHEGEAIWLADHPTQRHGHGHRGGIGGQADAVEPGLGQETYPP